MKRFQVVAAGLVFSIMALSFYGCSSSSSNPNVNIGQGCNPVSTDDCFLPFPSFYYLKQDPASATGYRVNYPQGILPVNKAGVALDPAPFNREDGFSPASQILAYFAQGVTPASLPSQNDVAASTLTTSPVQIINFTTGTRVPLFAEVDENTTPDQHQGLIIRPMIKLDNDAHYVVVILDSVQDLNGKPLAAPVPFVYLRDGQATSNGIVEGIRSRYEQLFSFLSDHGISRKHIVLAWDFTTASDSSITGHLISMRDQALAMTPTTGISYSLTVTTFTTDITSSAYNANIYKELTGTFSAPTFLDSKGYLVTDSTTGLPQYVGQAGYPILVHIPWCITDTTLPVPVMIYGHGLLGSNSEMDSGYQEGLINNGPLCMVQIGTNWIGLSESDIGNAASAVMNFNLMPLITDKLQQAQINVIVMGKLAIGALMTDTNMQFNGKPIIGNEIYYYGISQGGIEGVTFMSVDPDIIRGALGVPGSIYSIMMQRSHDFVELASVFNPSYPDPLDRLKLLSLSQYQWDFTDPISFASHVVNNPLPGTPKKQILIQAGLNDCQVPNLTTEILVRTMGIPAMDALPVSIYGIPLQPSPLDSAFTLWKVPDSTVYVPPATNIMPAQDNNVHEDIRRLTEVKDQLGLFFTTGGVVKQTCFATNGCTYFSATSFLP